MSIASFGEFTYRWLVGKGTWEGVLVCMCEDRYSKSKGLESYGEQTITMAECNRWISDHLPHYSMDVIKRWRQVFIYNFTQIFFNILTFHGRVDCKALSEIFLLEVQNCFVEIPKMFLLHWPRIWAALQYKVFFTPNNFFSNFMLTN